MSKRVLIYDTTLRDGTQAEGVAFNVEDRLRIAKKLDDMGFDYLEGGWPGSNKVSEVFFQRIREIPLKHIKLAAFGSTRHAKNKVEEDAQVQALLDADTPVVTIFGKSWDFHVTHALKIELDANLDMIGDTVAYLKKSGKETIYDAEHFFDGYKNNKEYAMATIRRAVEADADCLCLCETNGGALPGEVSEIVEIVKKEFPNVFLGIHTHNDSELGVANTLAAIEKGARHVQGTINGFGERCGNANLISIIANLELKMGYETIGQENLKGLQNLSHLVCELTNIRPNIRQPFVGSTCFTHKGGIHVSAMQRHSKTYEHIEPEKVGNRRRVLVSDQSGKSNLLFKAKEMGVELKADEPGIPALLKSIKELEHYGYQFEGADASFLLRLYKAKGERDSFFNLLTLRVTSQCDAKNDRVEATVKVAVGEEQEHTAAEGNGPVNAIDLALRKALIPFYPALAGMKLTDYKVRVLEENTGTSAKVRVLITSTDGKKTWSTVGVSENIIQASYIALQDSYNFMIQKIRSEIEKT